MARSQLQRNAKLCGEPARRTGRPCRWPCPCPYHSKNKQRKKKAQTTKNSNVLRHEKLIQGRLEGKSIVAAGRDAGYSENTLKGKIFQIMDSPAYKARIEALVKMSHLQTKEIIGGLVSESRMDLADLFPDDKLLQRAQQLGISQNIKRVKRRPIIAGFDQEGVPIYEFVGY